jgi:hypothetical protein
MTGDFLRGDTMENKDEVMEGVKRKNHSPQLTKVNQRMYPSKMPPAPPPILIPATPQHPSTPRRKLVPLLPRRTRLSNIVVISPPLVECQNQHVQRALAYPVLRIASSDHQQQHHDSGWLQNTPTSSGLDSNSIFSEEELKNRDLSAPDQPNNRWPNHLTKSVDILVQTMPKKCLRTHAIAGIEISSTSVQRAKTEQKMWRLRRETRSGKKLLTWPD